MIMPIYNMPELRAQAAELIEYLQRFVASDSRLSPAGNGWYTAEWLTAVLATHASYYGRGEPRCGAVWRSGNGNHPEGAVCAGEAHNWDWPGPMRPELSGDVPLCRHHHERMQDEARRFVREYEEWRETRGWEREERFVADLRKRERARAAAVETLLPTLGSTQAASKGKRHVVMPDDTTACGVAPVHPGGRWLDQPEGERCRPCTNGWSHHRSIYSIVDEELPE